MTSRAMTSQILSSLSIAKTEGRRDRSVRRAAARLAKTHARQILVGWGNDLDERIIGIMAGVHCRPCNCFGCTGHDGAMKVSDRRRFAATEVAE